MQRSIFIFLFPRRLAIPETIGKINSMRANIILHNLRRLCRNLIYKIINLFIRCLLKTFNRSSDIYRKYACTQYLLPFIFFFFLFIIIIRESIDKINIPSDLNENVHYYHLLSPYTKCAFYNFKIYYNNLFPSARPGRQPPSNREL